MGARDAPRAVLGHAPAWKIVAGGPSTAWKKKEPSRSPRELTWECAKMALKSERYRQISVEKIYDFVNRTL